jgi:hypothetical protein
MNVGLATLALPSFQPLTLPELRPTFGRKLLDRERGSARHCGLDLLAHLSLGRSGTPLRGGGVLFRHAASLSGMSQLTACAISTSQGTRSGSGRGMRPSANALASSMRFWGKVQGAGCSPALVGQPSPLLGELFRKKLVALGLKRDGLCFHSFRHTVAGASIRLGSRNRTPRGCSVTPWLGCPTAPAGRSRTQESRGGRRADRISGPSDLIPARPA